MNNIVNRQGRCQLKGPNHGMAVRFESEVNINVFRERDGSWQAIGEDMDRAIHNRGLRIFISAPTLFSTTRLRGSGRVRKRANLYFEH